jgi:hypothetical protein
MEVEENNIVINNSFHPHVWFLNSNDIFRNNIVSTEYMPIGIKAWGKEVDYNVFPDSISLGKAQRRGTDRHSVYGKLNFINPKAGDFRLKKGSIAFSVGFKNFAMDNFGIISPRLKSAAKKFPIPIPIILDKVAGDKIISFMGAKLKNLNTLGEQSATGMDSTRGVFVIDVTAGSSASEFLQNNDVILSFKNKPTNNLRDLLEARMSLIGSNTEIVIFRNLKAIKKLIVLGERK